MSCESFKSKCPKYEQKFVLHVKVLANHILLKLAFCYIFAYLGKWKTSNEGEKNIFFLWKFKFGDIRIEINGHLWIQVMGIIPMKLMTW